MLYTGLSGAHDLVQDIFVEKMLCNSDHTMISQ